MPRTVVISTAALAGLAGVIAYVYGARGVEVDPGGMVEQVAAFHVAERGGDATECKGWMADNGRDVAVRCAGTLYQIDVNGQIRIVTENGT